MHFSPCGQHLITLTAGGTFLWDVDSGTRVCKLAAPTNAAELVYSSDGSEVLIRNETHHFSRLSLPDGALLAKFKAKHPMRLEGTPGFGPDQLILQLAYGGQLLALDGQTGKVRQSLQLDAKGCGGEVYWFSRAGCWIIAQCCRGDGRGRNRTSWLWRWDPETPEPLRLSGPWDALSTARAPVDEALLLHHIVDHNNVLPCVLDHFDVASKESQRLWRCPGGIIPRPSVSHDGLSFGVATDQGPCLNLRGEILQLPGMSYVQFHPQRDLVGISGRAAFVAPGEAVGLQLPDLETLKLESELGQRAYSRLSTLAGAMPVRLTIFASQERWLVQAERIEGRYYAPLANAVTANPNDPGAIDAAIAAMRTLATTGQGQEEPATSGERRHFHGGTITPPSQGWDRALLVGISADAIDLWPLKPRGDLAFEHSHYPLAALPVDSTPDALRWAIAEMLGWFRPRRS